MLGFSPTGSEPIGSFGSETAPPPAVAAVIGWPEAGDSFQAVATVIAPSVRMTAGWVEATEAHQVGVTTGPAPVQVLAGWVEAAEGFQLVAEVAQPEFVRAPMGGSFSARRGSRARGKARVIVEPVEMAVALSVARDHAKVNGTDRDGEIEIEVRGLTAEAEHHTGRSIIDRTYEVMFNRFPEAIAAPSSPVSSVVSIKFIDPDGIERKLHPADYIVDDPSGQPVIVPDYGLTWPETQVRMNAVTVTVVCGYGPDHVTTPPAFKRYILARLQEVFAPPGSRESPHLIRALDSMVVY